MSSQGGHQAMYGLSGPQSQDGIYPGNGRTRVQFEMLRILVNTHGINPACLLSYGDYDKPNLKRSPQKFGGLTYRHLEVFSLSGGMSKLGIRLELLRRRVSQKMSVLDFKSPPSPKDSIVSMLLVLALIDGAIAKVVIGSNEEETIIIRKIENIFEALTTKKGMRVKWEKDSLDEPVFRIPSPSSASFRALNQKIFSLQNQLAEAAKFKPGTFVEATEFSCDHEVELCQQSLNKHEQRPIDFGSYYDPKPFLDAMIRFEGDPLEGGVYAAVLQRLLRVSNTIFLY